MQQQFQLKTSLRTIISVPAGRSEQTTEMEAFSNPTWKDVQVLGFRVFLA